MAILYRYFDKWGLNVLSEGRIRLKPPNEYNDPFEFSPRFIDVSPMTREGLVELLRNDFDVWYERVGRFQNHASKEAAREHVKTHEDEVVDDMISAAPDNVEKLKEDFLRQSSETIAVGCFSKNHKSLLMWSHYADKHAGILIGFDTKHHPFNDTERLDIFPVEYQSERAIYTHHRTVPEFWRSFSVVARRKGLVWEYENEVRIVIYQRLLDEPGFLSLSPKAVTCVVFGCRCSLSYKMSARQFLDQPRLLHAAIYQAKEHKTDYKLDFVKVRGGRRR